MKYLVVATLCLASAACQFDASGLGGGFGGTSQDKAAFPDLDQPDLPPYPGDQGELAYVATSEETRHGELLAGSYVDSQTLDGQFEAIGAEIDKGDERLEQKWFVDRVPAGTYQLTLVLSPFTPKVEAYKVEYKVDGGKYGSLFLIPGDGLLQDYEGTVTFDADTALELRAKLDHVQAETDVASSVLEVDYMALLPSSVGVGPSASSASLSN